MYTKVDAELWPLGLEELEYLSKQLKQACWDYEVRMERLMFAGMDKYPPVRFAIWKWSRSADPYMTRPTPTVIWEGEDKAQCAGMLRMLIGIERDAANNVRDQGVIR